MGPWFGAIARKDHINFKVGEGAKDTGTSGLMSMIRKLLGARRYGALIYRRFPRFGRADERSGRALQARC